MNIGGDVCCIGEVSAAKAKAAAVDEVPSPVDAAAEQRIRS